MNNMVKIASLSAVAALVMGSINLANAAPVSVPVTGAGDVVFSETATATMVVTPVAGLFAGAVEASTVVANATATASAAKVAYRWSPDKSTQRGSAFERTISGKNLASNKLDVISVETPASTESGENGYNEWRVSTGTSLAIAIKTSSTVQTVAADTYVVSLDAAVWSN